MDIEMKAAFSMGKAFADADFKIGRNCLYRFWRRNPMEREKFLPLWSHHPHTPVYAMHDR